MIRMCAMFVVIVLLAAPGNAVAAPVECNSPTNVVIATICASPMLTARDAKIAQRYEQLQTFCSSEKNKIFGATQRFWLRERSNCQLATSASR